MAITFKAAKALRSIFIDENIVIYLKDMNVVTVDPDQNTMNISAMIQGYVIDIDENFYYLGNQDGYVVKVVSHDIAQIVEIFEEASPMTDEMPNPDEDVH